MLLLVKLIGLLIMAFGVWICVSPAMIQKVFAFFIEGKRLYYAGLIRTLAGLALLVSASQSRLPLAAVSLGVLFLLSGAIIFVTGPEKMKAFIQQYTNLPELAVRLLGLVAASFGLLIISIF